MACVSKKISQKDLYLKTLESLKSSSASRTQSCTISNKFPKAFKKLSKSFQKFSKLFEKSQNFLKRFRSFRNNQKLS